MATANVAAIQKLYVAYFNRPADPIGLDAWVKALDSGAATIEQIGAGFAASDEYKATYAGMNDVQTIAAIYQNLFGREADVDGLKFWVGQLQAGSYTIDQAVQIIADSALNSNNADGKIVANRIAAATAFTNAIDTTAEIIGYSGAAANNAAKGFLNGITTDASLEAAIVPATLDKSVASVIEQAQNAAGQKYALTTGVDTLTGTAFNDTFTVNTFTTSGTSATTLQSFDSIDGGAGTDTLNLFAASGFNNTLTGSVKNVELINIVGSDFIGSSLTATQQQAIVTARQDVADKTAALTAANTANTSAQAALVTATAASTTIQTAVLSAQEPTTVGAVGGSVAYDPTSTSNNQTTAAFNAIVNTVSNLQANQASKDFVLNFLRAHTSEIFTEETTDVNGDPITVNRTAEDVFSQAAAAVGAALQDYEAAIQQTADDADKAADLADAALTTAQGKLTTAEGAANHATVDASFFAGSTQIKVDGVVTNVTKVGAQNIVFTGADVTNNISYGSTATTGTVTLTGTRGTIGLTGSKLETANITGTVSKATVDGASVAGTLTLNSTTVKTLNAGLTSAAELNVAGLTALTTIAAGASTGALEITGASNKVSSITTGSGNDVVTLATALSSTVKTASVVTGAGDDDITVNLSGTSKGSTATVDAGDGNDTITIVSTGPAAMTIKAGAGDDTVIFTDLNAVATADLVDGGEGTDTLAIGGATLQAGDYVVLNETVTNFEAIAFLGGETVVDASRIAGYKSITLSNAEASIDNSAVTKVAADQTVNILAANHHDDVAVSAAGYDDTGATTVYGGDLTVNVTGTEATGMGITESFGIDLEAYASALKLAVTSTADAAAYVTLTGDVKSATVTLTNASIENDDGDLVGQHTAQFNLDTGEGNAALTSLTLTGTGYAEVHNEDKSALATINASGLTGQQYVAAEGDEEAAIGFGNGLHYTSNNLSVVETITLGAGRDYVELSGSSYTKTDIVTGLSLVADATATGSTPTLDVDASDAITIGQGTTVFSHFEAVAAADLTGNSLNTVLRNLGLSSAAGGDAGHEFVFQYQGNTYIYVDVAADATAATPVFGLSDNDVVVKLTGAVDLDLLTQALNGVA